MLFCKELIAAVQRMTTFNSGLGVPAGGSVLCDSPVASRVKQVNEGTKSLSGSESGSNQFVPWG